MPGASPRALRNTLIHPLARMLPLLRFQLQTYRFGEKNPPSGSMLGHAPHWAITTLVLDPMASTQVRMNLQPDFHWLATVASITPVRQPVPLGTFPITSIEITCGSQNCETWVLAPGIEQNTPVGSIITFDGLTTATGLNGTSFPIVEFDGQSPGWFLVLVPTGTVGDTGGDVPETGTGTVVSAGSGRKGRGLPVKPAKIQTVNVTGSERSDFSGVIWFTVSPNQSAQAGDQVTPSGTTNFPAVNGRTFTVTVSGGGINQDGLANAGDPGWIGVGFVDQGQPAQALSPDTGIITIVTPDQPSGSRGPGFRAQIYDTRKGLRFGDRGVRVANLGGDTHGVQWMRDPYHFDLPNSQVLLIVQNLEAQQNEIQIALYGQVLRFNQNAGTN